LKNNISKSPERHTFQKTQFIKRQLEANSMDTPETISTLKFFDDLLTEQEKLESNDKWRENNLEYDLRSTDWILTKVRGNEQYAQHLYAALCNNEFIKLDVMPILKNQKWSCSWRSAGGIIANMREQGDYIDWYCSGIVDTNDFVSESVVTDEIRADLKKLGWIVCDS